MHEFVTLEMGRILSRCYVDAVSARAFGVGFFRVCWFGATGRV